MRLDANMDGGARNMSALEPVTLEPMPETNTKQGNMSFEGDTSTTRHVAFSTQLTTEALEGKISQETELESTFFVRTLNITSEDEGNELHDNLVWKLIQDGEMDLGLLAASLGILLAVIVMVSLYFMMRSRRFYSRIPGTCEGQDQGYIYKPLVGGALDEEYENTFVGVSVPLVQDVTKV